MFWRAGASVAEDAPLDAALLQMSERGDLKDTGAPQVIQKPAQVRYELGAVVDVRAARLEGITPMPSRSAIGWQTQPEQAQANEATSRPLTLPRAPLAPRRLPDPAP